MIDQEKIVRLIIAIDKIVEDEFYEDTLYHDSNDLDIFSDELDSIFEDGINENILKMINTLKYKNIFRLTYTDKYTNNKIRIQIENYLNSHNKLYLDYELIKNNILDDYKLVNYLKDMNKVEELVNINEKVLLEIEGKYATKELIEERLHNNHFLAEVLLGIYGNDNDIYRYSMYYKDIKNIDNILFEQLKDKLSDNPSLYINASELIKKNTKIQNLVVYADSRLSAYITN